VRKPYPVRYTRHCYLALFVGVYASLAGALALERPADALLAIDQHRASVIEQIVDVWGAPLAKSSEAVSIDELRARLGGLRADQLLAASLTGTLDGLREVLGTSTSSTSDSTSRPGLRQTKSLGDTAQDVVYTPITPCRLVETRGTFAEVYQGAGTPAHNPVPYAANEIRSYTVQGGNGVCLTQLPAGRAPTAVQLQVFGIPTTAASGDIEILPQGSTFGNTATMVYVASIAFNTVSTSARINLANNQISVQVPWRRSQSGDGRGGIFRHSRRQRRAVLPSGRQRVWNGSGARDARQSAAVRSCGWEVRLGIAPGTYRGQSGDKEHHRRQ
jgi:hypothetical protein